MTTLLTTPRSQQARWLQRTLPTRSDDAGPVEREVRRADTSRLRLMVALIGR
jgi:hypothetical protein